MELLSLLPLSNERLALTYGEGVSLEEIKDYLKVNGIDAEVDSKGNLYWDFSNDLKATLPKWEGLKQLIEIDIPVGVTVKEVEWLKPEIEVIPIRWEHQRVDGSRYYPVTHWDAVLDKDGQPISSRFSWMEETLKDVAAREDMLEKRMLKFVVGYFIADCENAGAGGFKDSKTPKSLYIGDSISWNGDPDYKCGLIDAAGNVLIESTNSAWEYTATDDLKVSLFTDAINHSVPYTTNTLSVRGGGGGVQMQVNGDVVNLTNPDTGVSFDAPSVDSLTEADETTITKTTDNKFAVKDGSIGEDQITTELKEKIESAGSADEVTITKDATSGEMSVKDGGIDEDKLEATLKQKIEDAGKADGTTIVKNADSTLSVKDGGVSAAKLAADAVETAKIKDGAVTKAKLATDVFDDLDVTDTAVDGNYVSAVSETNGKISVTRKAFDTSLNATSTNAPTTKAVYEATNVDGTTIERASNKLQIKDGGVTFAKLADAAVVTSTEAATAANITDTAVPTASGAKKIAEDVVAAKVGDPDGVTVERTTAGKLQIKEDGVAAKHINPDVAGDGLVQNSTSGALDVNVDKETLTITSDKIAVNIDKKTLVYNTTDKVVEAAIDKKTIQYNTTDKVMEVKLDGETLVYDDATGKKHVKVNIDGKSLRYNSDAAKKVVEVALGGASLTFADSTDANLKEKLRIAREGIVGSMFNSGIVDGEYMVVADKLDSAGAVIKDSENQNEKIIDFSENFKEKVEILNCFFLTQEDGFYIVDEDLNPGFLLTTASYGPGNVLLSGGCDGINLVTEIEDAARLLPLP